MRSKKGKVGSSSKPRRRKRKQTVRVQYGVLPYRFSQDAAELCGKVGDGVNQAADLISATASIPSLNCIPLTTFGNWF